MQCATCRAVIPPGARFCLRCGAPAPTPCRACAFLNPPEANFCSRCGATLNVPSASHAAALPPAVGVAEPEPAERRQLTVLFCDLVGSTALSTRLDPEVLREVIGALHRFIAQTTLRFGGFVARYMGDGALVYFGYPRASEDSAEQAARAGLALVNQIAAVHIAQEALHLRVGIATGVVVVGELVEAGGGNELTALGEAPNLAARLQSIAEPDSVVIAESTRRLVGGSFECDDLGSFGLRGFAAPVRAWRLAGEARSHRPFHTRAAGAPSSLSASSSGDCRALIGRDAELARLDALWQEVRNGAGQVVLVIGEPGIGKSRLAQVFAQRLEPLSHHHLDFRCSHNYSQSPFHPVITVLPAVIGSGRNDSAETRLGKLEAFCRAQRLYLDEAMPLLIALLSLPPSARFPLASMSPERQRSSTLRVLVDIVLSFASEQPLLMVVDDVHWVDPSTMEFLTLLTSRLKSCPVLLLYTARTPFEPPSAPMRQATRMLLTRFTEGETQMLVEQIADRRRLPDDVLSEIVRKTDGVPLFVEELTKMVLESGRANAEEQSGLAGPLPPLAIPATLQDSLAARLDRLDAAKPLAQLCATLGREFSYAMLRAVSPLDEEVLRAGLAQLVGAELLYETGRPPEASYAFKHALIQEAAYESLLRSTRRQYHGRIARVMVEQLGAEAERHPEVVAFHQTHAGDTDAAVHWWQKAGQRAFQRAAYAEAIAHYRSGLAALDALPETPKRDQAELALQVELGYAMIPLRGWAAPDTAQAFTRAGLLCQRIGDTPRLFRALWGVGAFHFVRGDLRNARRMAEQCLNLAGARHDVDARIAAHYLAGIVGCASGSPVAAAHDLEQCIGRYGDEPRLAHRVQYGQDSKASALAWLGLALWTLGEPDAALTRAEEGLAFVRDSAQPFLLSRGLAGVGFVHVFRGEAQAADGPLPRALAICNEQRFTYFGAVVSAFHGSNLVLLGDAAAGIARMQASIERLRALGSDLLLTLIYGHLARAQLAAGEIDGALESVEAGLRCVVGNDEHWGEPELHRLRGLVLLARDAAPVAVEGCMRSALDLALQQQARSYALRAATSLAGYLHAQGRSVQARAALAPELLHWRAMNAPDLREAIALMAELDRVR